jgi:PPP family 3-phenylpropionic acid transporter
MSILVFLAVSGPVAGALAVEDIVWLLTAVAALACVACMGSLIGFGSSSVRVERQSSVGRIARPELVALVIVAAALVQSSHSMVNTFGALHWKEQGHSDSFVAFAWVVALATEVVAFLMAARWFGGESKAGAFLLVGAIGAVLRWLLMSADPGPTGIFCAQALHGASCAAVQIGPAYLLAELGGKERLAQSQAWLAAAIAGGNSLFTFLSGPLYAQAGERAYLAMAAVAFVGLLLSCAVAQLCATRHARTQAARVETHAEPEHSSA